MSQKNYVSFECYIDDPYGYDRLKTDPNKVYETFTSEWYTVKRRVLFDSLGVISVLGTLITYLLLFRQE